MCQFVIYYFWNNLGGAEAVTIFKSCCFSCFCQGEHWIGMILSSQTIWFQVVHFSCSPIRLSKYSDHPVETPAPVSKRKLLNWSLCCSCDTAHASMYICREQTVSDTVLLEIYCLFWGGGHKDAWLRKLVDFNFCRREVLGSYFTPLFIYTKSAKND